MRNQQTCDHNTGKKRFIFLVSWFSCFSVQYYDHIILSSRYNEQRNIAPGYQDCIAVRCWYIENFHGCAYERQCILTQGAGMYLAERTKIATTLHGVLLYLPQPCMVFMVCFVVLSIHIQDSRNGRIPLRLSRHPQPLAHLLRPLPCMPYHLHCERGAGAHLAERTKMATRTSWTSFRCAGAPHLSDTHELHACAVSGLSEQQLRWIGRKRHAPAQY